MGLEVSTTIAGLNSAWPLGTDKKGEGDDHLRLLKAVLKHAFDDSDAGGGVGQMLIKDAAGNTLMTLQANHLIGTYVIDAILADLIVKEKPSGSGGVIAVYLTDKTDKKRCVLAANTSGNVVVLQYYDAAGTTLVQQMTMDAATGLQLSNGGAAGTVLTTGNIAYKLHLQNETMFPISTILPVICTLGTIGRQAAVSPFQHSTNAGLYALDGSVGAALAGSWSARGLANAAAVGGQFTYLIERIS